MPAWIALGVKSSSSVASWPGRSPPPSPPQAVRPRATARIVAIVAKRVTTQDDDRMGERAWTSYVAEFLGTFFLVLFICLTACVTTAGIGDGLTAQALLIIAGAHVIAL